MDELKLIKDIYNAQCKIAYLNNTKITVPAKLANVMPLRKAGIKSMTVFNLFVSINTHDNQATMSDIARDLSITRAGATVLVDKQEKLGNVERFQVSGNRRNTFVRLTEKTERLLEKQEDLIHENFLEQIKTHTTREERERLIEYANFIVDVFNRFD